MRKGLAKIKKELASRYFQLLSGHAATGEHLTRIGQVNSLHCWWCGTGEKQTRYHLFVKCRRWKLEITRMWKRIRLDCGWGGAPSIRRLFRDEKGVPAVLEFLRDTRVGKMPSQVQLAGGPEVEEEDLEVISLLVQGEEEQGTGVSSSEEEDGPGPPL